MIEEAKAYIENKDALTKDKYIDVVKTFISANGNRKGEKIQLENILSGKDVLYDICRIARIMNSFSEGEKTYNDFYIDLKKFIDTTEELLKINK